VIFQVLTAASIKMTDFWDKGRVVLLEEIDVSEVRTASIIRAMNYGLPL
jgi:hypothetical protein